MHLIDHKVLQSYVVVPQFALFPVEGYCGVPRKTKAESCVYVHRCGLSAAASILNCIFVKSRYCPAPDERAVGARSDRVKRR